MKKGVIILIGMFILLGVFAFSSGAGVVSHYANQIRPGMFGQVYTGNWSFMNGSVGIGTSNPTTGLYVLDTSNSAHGVIINTTSSNSNYAALHVVRNGTTLLWVGKNGNIGIGFKNPSFPLDVYGTLRSTAVVTTYLDANNWSDFSTATNGYAKMANIMIQWGTYYSSIDNAQSFNFPVAFPNGCLAVVSTVRLSTTNYDILCDKTSFTIDRADELNDAYFNMIAIGY